MKQFIVILGLLIGASHFESLAADREDLNPKARATLERMFSGAKQIKWQELKEFNLYRAWFTYNNEVLTAFFEEDGTFINSNRNILPSNLPLLVYMEITESYSKYAITEIVERMSNEETSYIVNLDGKKHKLIVQIYSNGTSYVVKREKKK